MSFAAKPTPEHAALWYRALASEFGIELTVTAPDLQIADLYAARKLANDPKLEALQVTRMKDGTIWIVKKEIRLEDDDAPALT